MKPTKLSNIPGNLRNLAANIPRSHLVLLGKGLGIIAFVIAHRHRRIVSSNLKFIHPRWSRNRIQKLSRDIFKNFGIAILEILQLACMSREDILRKVKLKGEQHLTHALKESKGIIIISAHIGNWEMAPLFVSNYFRKHVVSVARHVRFKVLDRWIYGLRTRFGNTIIDKKKALPAMARALKKGDILGILIDQGTKRSEGVEVEFLGQTTTATPVAALLARRFDVPVLPCYCVREPGAYLKVILEPSLDLVKTDDLRADSRNNTQMMTEAIEKAVKAYPEQWFWFHKRWKRHHPHVYPEEIARRQRRKKRKIHKLKNLKYHE